MAKILSIIILIALIGGGGWYYTNKMKVSEGTPVGFESRRGDKDNRYDNKFDNKSFVVTFPNASTTLMLGQKVDTKWNSSSKFNLKLTYPVVLINADDKTKKPIQLGTAKNSLFNKVFTWTVPQDITPGNYKIVFLGKQGGESQVFSVVSSVDTFFKFTSPTASTTMYLDKTGEVRWVGSDYGVTEYAVYLVGGALGDIGSIPLGTVTSGAQYFSFKFPNTVQPGNGYQISFSGKGATGGNSPSFSIEKNAPPENNPGPAVFSKISSNLTVVKNNNIDVGINASFKLNIQANGSNIHASGTTAVVVLKDSITGKTIETKIVTVTSLESNLMFYPEGITKTVSIETIFPVSIFLAGGNNVKASIYSISYTTPGTSIKPSGSYTALDFGLYDTNVTTIFRNTPPTAFTEDLTLGSSGTQVLLLKKTLAAKGYGPLLPGDSFDESTRVALAKYQTSVGISPATGIFGAMTRARLNAELSNPPTVSN